MSEHPPGDEGSEPTISGDLTEEIRRRAWEISQRPDSGSPEENWRRAEEELGQEQEAGSLSATD